MGSNIKGTKVSIIGAGFVGSTFAHSLLLSGLVNEIVLIDINKDKAAGEAQDISHCVPYVRPARVYDGNYSDCKGSDIIVITSGTAQKQGETRLDLVNRNSKIMRDVITEIKEYTTTAILIIVANPVDVLTYVAIKEYNNNTQLVFGSGTTLDTARLRYLIAYHCHVDPRNVHSYVIGEHGDSEVIVWSSSTIGGIKIYEFADSCGIDFSEDYKKELEDRVKYAAYEIIDKKGATYYGVSAALVKIVETIVRNQNAILPVSIYVDDFKGIGDVCFSIPAIVNKSGIVKHLDLSINDKEFEQLKKSAETLSEVNKNLDY